MGQGRKAIKASLGVVLASCLCVALFLKTILPAQSFAEEKSYNATTPEECVEEKECVWTMFQQSVFDVDGVLHKWNQPIKIHASHYSAQTTSYFLEPAVENLVELGVPEIQLYDEDYNFKIIVSRDIYTDLRKYKGELTEKFHEDPLEFFHSSKIKSIGQKLIIPFFDDQKDFQGAILFVNKQYAYNIRPYIFEVLGFKKAHAFARQGVIEILDLKLLELLYRKEFISGMNENEARVVFDEIYKTGKGI